MAKKSIRKTRRSIHKGRVFELFHDEVTLPNTVSTTVDLIDHPGASAVIPVTEKGHILLIRQYRYAVDDYILEIPAGTREKGEPFLSCAKRELIEETGYGAKHFNQLSEITPVPGYSNERVALFLARELYKTTQHLDTDEIIELVELSMGDAVRLIHEGKIQDAKTICGILLAEKYLRK